MKRKLSVPLSPALPTVGILCYLFLSAISSHVPSRALPELPRAIFLLFFALIYGKAAMNTGLRLLPRTAGFSFAGLLPLLGLLQFVKGFLAKAPHPAAVTVLLCLGVAASEELLFRGTLTPLLKKRLPYPAALLLSDGIFAALHGLNLLTGHSPAAVLFQIAAAFLCGLFLEALYGDDGAGGILPCVLFHFLFNVSGRFSPDNLTADLILLAVYAALTLILFITRRKSRRK